MICLKNLAMRIRASFAVPGHLAGGIARTSTTTHPLRRLLPTLALLPVLGMAGTAQAQSCAANETPVQFGFTGGEQTTIVPAGVRSLTVYLSGAQGGTGRSGAGTIGGSPNSPGGAGGLGGRVRGTLAVTPGALLSIFVGGQASQAVNPGGTGHGTTSTSGIGGGGTDLRIGGNGIGNRVGIAGGGGGGGAAGWSSTNVVAGGNGGVGGGGMGGAGTNVPGGVGPFGGGGGTVGTGGAPGNGCGTFPATAGNAANGNGGNSNNFSGSFAFAGFGGGGGGGATVGAGGGGAGVGTTGCQQNWNGGGGGGAGGSSGAAGLTAVTINNGVQAGNGAALICYAASSYGFSGTASGQTGAVTLQLVGSNPASSQQVTVAQNAASFAFPNRLPAGSGWNVSVTGTPPGQVCSVSPASGMALAADVALALTCATVTVTIAPTTLPDAALAVAYAQTLSASSSNGGAAPYTFAVTAGALPGGITLSSAGALAGTPSAAGTFNFTVQATASNGFTGSQSYTLVVAQAAQAITDFTATPTAPVFTPNGTFTVSATGGASTSPVVFGSTSPSVCTVSGSTVTMLSAGNCALTADQAGDANYTAAPQVTLNVAIGAAGQVITNFTATPTAPVFTPNGTFTVSATGGASTSPVVFGSTSPSVCTVSGSTVTMLSAGSCALTADQAGDANYGAAPQVTLNVAIGAAGQVITNFTATPTAPVFTPNGTFTVSATGGASTSPVVFGSTSPSVCTVSGSTVTMLSAGTCALTADQAGDANYGAAPQITLNVVIGAAGQVITDFTATPTAPVFTPNGTFTVSATGGASTSPVVFGSTSPSVCTVSGSTVTMLSAGACVLTADQAGDANYGAAPQVTLRVTIGAATPTLRWIGDLQKSVGEASFDLPDPNSDSAGGYTFSSSNPAVATVNGRRVTILAGGLTTLVATQAAAGSYAQGTASATLTVSDRPDPTRDPGVVSGLQAQVDASVRFASAQQSNIHDRLRQQRYSDANASSNTVSLNLANGSGAGLSLPASQLAAGDDPMRPTKRWALWSAGVITAGERDGQRGSKGFDFRSDGVTIGADWRSERGMLVGIAGGFGWNDTDVDGSRSGLDADQRSLSVYGLWRPGEHLFLDGLLGWGQLDFDITRWSDTAGASAQAKREGDQAFGSLTLGYERNSGNLLLTGYGRLDASKTTLDGYRENGLGIYDLAYREQTVDTSSVAVGVEGSYLFAGSASQIRPYWMLEYRDAFENRSDVALNYVVMPNANDYRLGLRSYGDNAFTYGAGLDLSFAASWRLSLLFRREHASGQTDASSFGLLLSFSPRLRAAADAAATALSSAPPATGD